MGQGHCQPASPSSGWSSTSGGPGELVVEVRAARDLGRPAYRPLDLSKALVRRSFSRGTQLLHAYVEVTCNGSRGLSEHVKVARGCETASFEQAQFLFPLQHVAPHSTVELNLSAFDKRDSLMSDPLIGEAVLEVAIADIVGKHMDSSVLLERRDRARGQLDLRCSFRPMLRKPGGATLQGVAIAFAQVLSGENGLKILLDSVPQGMAAPSEEGEAAGLRVSALTELLVSLLHQVSMLGGESDEEVLRRFSRLSRSIQDIVAEHAEGLSPDVMKLAMSWLDRISRECKAQSTELQKAGLSGEMLQKFLLAGQQHPGIADLVPIDGSGQEAKCPGKGSHVPEDSVLGTGAYGEVWRAKDTRTGLWYAVKRQRPARTNKLLTREREVTNHILMCPHPCIIELFGTYHHERYGGPSLLMEYCDSGSLQGRIELLARGNEDYQPPAEASFVLAQILLALEHLHTALDSLSRDLKPENVLLTKRWRAKLTDFGLSRIGKESDGAWSLQNAPPGSPHYIAPEVVLKEPYDFRADLYSFGVLIWTYLTGGLRATPGYPPVARMTNRYDYQAVVGNSALLQRAIRDHAAWGARPLPSEESRCLVLALTVRRAFARPDHERIRASPFMLPLDLPAPGASTREVEAWLREGSLALNRSAFID